MSERGSRSSERTPSEPRPAYETNGPYDLHISVAGYSSWLGETEPTHTSKGILGDTRVTWTHVPLRAASLSQAARASLMAGWFSQ